MSFNAYDINRKEIDLSKGIPKRVSSDDVFYCCGCNSVLHLKAIHSNLRAAHFAGKHEPWCDEPSGNRSKEQVDDFQLKSGDFENLLAKLIADGVKEKGDDKPSSPVSGKTTTSTPTTPRPGVSKQLNILDVKSIRYLYQLLRNESFNKVLYDNTRICDIYCGPSTKHIYTKYISGLHLVHCQYNWRSKSQPRLFFRFPTVDKTQIKIFADFIDHDLYDLAVSILDKHYKKPVLLFADFTDSYCQIQSLTQVVPL